MIDPSSHKTDYLDACLPPIKGVAECRICHDEDQVLNLETPCACCGSLKYAHRKCVQRWCNEKGDTICEICGQSYKPGYTAPTHLFRLGAVQLPLRGNWELPRRNHHNPYFVSMVASDRDLLEPILDVYPSSRSIFCCRIIAIIVFHSLHLSCSPVLGILTSHISEAKIFFVLVSSSAQFMTLLVLRHILPIIIDGTGVYSFTFYTLLVLRTMGILLPILVMFKLCSDVQQRRRHRQRIADNFNSVTSDEENDIQRAQPQLRLIHVQ